MIPPHAPWRVMLFVPVWNYSVRPLFYMDFHDAISEQQLTTLAIIGGSWIRDSQAQSILLDLLRRTEAENGWPWTFMIQKLSQDWRLTVR